MEYVPILREKNNYLFNLASGLINKSPILVKRKNYNCLIVVGDNERMRHKFTNGTSFMVQSSVIDINNTYS